MEIFKTCLVIVELMEHFVAHPLSGSPAEYMSAGHVGKALDLAGSGGSLSLAYIGILIVDHICGIETGAGAAGHGTGTAGDAALVVFVPHGMAL